jgi:hypothetical protein
MNSHGMHETGGEPYFYSNYTWKELRDVPAQRRVVLLPVGSTEDHGHPGADDRAGPGVPRPAARPAPGYARRRSRGGFRVEAIR